MPLILKYVRTAKPLLTEPTDIDMYTVALAESSLLEAWQFQRTFPEVGEVRPRLVHKILEWCLSRMLLSVMSFPHLVISLFLAHPRPKALTQLLAFPFSNYEQTLIHKYALQPPSTLPPPSVPIIQDLVCVRLIHSGQYAPAIKLDRQFAASVIPGTTSKMQKSIQDRRKMMDDILATLPAVERTMVEAELDVETTGVAPGRVRVEQSWREGKGRLAPVNGSVVPDKITPKDLPQFGSTPTVPISARNDMSRFGGADSRLPDPINGSTFVPISTSTSTPSQVHDPVHQSPFTPRSSHLFSLSSSQNSRLPAPLLGSSGVKYPVPLFSHPSRSTTKPTSSLFTMSGSANQTRNAFYTPPATNGVKRSLGDDEPRPTIEAAPDTVDEPLAPLASGDVDMESEDDLVPTHITDGPHANGTEDVAPAELSYSVFGTSSITKQPPRKSRRVTRAESELKMPPGAYIPDEEELAEGAGQNQNQRHASVSPPPLPPVKTTRSSSSRAHKLAHEPDLKRSLPGTFMSEEDNEEEDYIAPLPALPPHSKRPARKGRSVRSVEPEEKKGQSARPTRRSTRLSAASSVASTSPEPPSPRKLAAKTRKTKPTGSTGSKTGSRKK